jgi:type I restriction enzyme S subunit
MEQKMNENWITKKLGEVCSIKTGKKDVNYSSPDGAYPFFTCAAKQYLAPDYSFDTEALILPGNGVNVGKVFYYKGKFEAYQRTYILEVITEHISAQYLYIYLQYTWKDYIANKQYGAATNYIIYPTIYELIVSFPPLDEQQRIVAKLDEAFAAIAKARENTERNLCNARELFEAYLESVFANPGEGWGEEKLGHVCKFDKTHSHKTGLPYIGLEDIESGSGRFIGSLLGRNVKSSTFYFTAEHILFGRLRPYLNKVFLPYFAGHCSTEIFPIKPDNQLEKVFLYYWLVSSKVVEKINATCTGTRMPRANMNSVLEFPIPLPPLHQQMTIVTKLNTLSAQTKKLESIYHQKLAALDELKKSLLQKAFNGEL